jgi:hypothetical protein
MLVPSCSRMTGRAWSGRGTPRCGPGTTIRHARASQGRPRGGVHLIGERDHPAHAAAGREPEHPGEEPRFARSPRRGRGSRTCPGPGTRSVSGSKPLRPWCCHAGGRCRHRWHHPSAKPGATRSAGIPRGTRAVIRAPPYGNGRRRPSHGRTAGGQGDRPARPTRTADSSPRCGGWVRIRGAVALGRSRPSSRWTPQRPVPQQAGHAGLCRLGQ